MGDTNVPSIRLGRPTHILHEISATRTRNYHLKVVDDRPGAISETPRPMVALGSRPAYQESDIRKRSPFPSTTMPAQVSEEGPLPSLPYPLTAGNDNTPTATKGLSLRTPDTASSGPQIGNLLLSSCPGKKVRLSGPVKGRGAICRSLPQDLARIRSLNVGLIINCLDDTELSFLGAPWEEYSKAANALGLDVLRIPTPEGLAPLEPGTLDRQLDWVIRQYTLRGVNVLVHCRGGVGRAGLVACCWAIKLGLCGPVSEALQALQEQSDQSTAAIPPAIPWPTLIAHGVLRRETFGVVERAVIAIRKRRSVKAIETYEQARFLIDFVEHLRDGQEARLRMRAIRSRSARTVDAEPEFDANTDDTEASSSSTGSSPPSIGRRSEATDDTLVESDVQMTDLSSTAEIPIKAD